MYDVFINYLSPELMSQAQYINGALYLPVYPFFSEVLTAVGGLVMASLIVFASGIIFELVFRFSSWLYRRLKK